MGFVPVIDDGSCVVNERCMPNDDGVATASSNRLGYHVIERIDARHVLIAIEPNGDMVQRIRTDVLALEDGVAKLDKDISNLETNISDLEADVSALEENKVAKVTGKGLSTNDFTKAYKEKLDGIEAGANKFVLQDKSVTKAKLAGDVTPAAIGAAALDSEGKVKAEQTSSDIKSISTQKYTLVAEDCGKFLLFTYSGDVTITIPADTSFALFPAGTEIEIFSGATGVKSITITTSNTDVAFMGRTGKESSVQLDTTYYYGTIVLKRIYSNRWVAKGDVK